MSTANYQPYPVYEESGIEWVGKTPVEWRVQPFFVHASQCKRSNKGMVNDNLLSLSFGQVIRKNIETSEGLLPESFETYQVIEPGDVIFRLTDLQNDKRSLRSALCREYGIITSAYLAAKPVGIDPIYLAYLMRSYDLTKVLYALGSGLRQSLKYSDMKRLPLLVPPLKEQTQIAKFLDYETGKMDALIEKQQQLIRLLKEKRQAVISHAVTKGLNPAAPMRGSGIEWLGEVPAHWEVSQLKFNTLEMQTGPFGSQLHAEDYVEGGIPLINPAHMVDGGITPESSCSVDLQTQERLGRHKLSEDDVIFARRGELGRCAVIRKEQVGWLCGTGSLRATLSPKLSPNYAFMLVSSKGVRTELSLESRGSTMENLNTSTLGKIRLPVPPREEQESILRDIEDIAGTFDAMEANAERQNALLQERRTALISAAVTGKIDVRKWKPPAPRSQTETP